jgi:acylglycerol lipase
MMFFFTVGCFGSAEAVFFSPVAPRLGPKLFAFSYTNFYFFAIQRCGMVVMSVLILCFDLSDPHFSLILSMGGAVAFSVHKRIFHLIKGVVFVCPMCKISEDMLPPQGVIDILTWLIGPSGSTSLLGYLPIAPAKQSLGDVAHKVKAKKDLYARNPLSFGRNPRLATARELIKVTQMISNSLSSFDASFLVVHGKADRVTDPRLSQALYNECKSKDKTIHLYEGMWHGLTCTEPDENIDRVFSDATRWILERCQ